jgi:hypothetical protein
MNLAGAWIVTSVALNAVLTVMIIVKLWPARAQRKSGSIAAPVGRRAASAMGMLAESAAFYTISGVFFVITQFIGSDYAILFGQIFGVTAVSSPEPFPWVSNLTGLPVPEHQHHYFQDRDGNRIRPFWKLRSALLDLSHSLDDCFRR